jgi:hypothetical protein
VKQKIYLDAFLGPNVASQTAQAPWVEEALYQGVANVFTGRLRGHVRKAFLGNKQHFYVWFNGMRI